MSRMRVGLIVICGLALTAIAPGSAPAQNLSRASVIVSNASMVFDQITNNPDTGIPSGLLNDAQGIAVFPSLIRAGFVFGGRHGEGVLSTRRPDGTWSNPIFLNLTGASFGAQVGVESSDLILVFRNRRSIDRFLMGRGKLTLNADASLAAGPVGRQYGAGTDLRLTAEILAYSRNRGLFAGLAAGGSSVSPARRLNTMYYGIDGENPFAIMRTDDVAVRPEAQQFIALLDQRAPVGVLVEPHTIVTPRADDPSLERVPSDEPIIDDDVPAAPRTSQSGRPQSQPADSVPRVSQRTTTRPQTSPAPEVLESKPRSAPGSTPLPSPPGD